MEIPDELVTSLLSHDCVLFTGAGMTQATGGKSWAGLIKELITRFNYSSVYTEDWESHPERYQEIVDDIFAQNEPQVVYEAVHDILQGVNIDNELFPLVKLPWLTVFTTNYDTALEKVLKETHKDQTITPIITGDQYMLPGKNRELSIVYLMGSVDVPYGSDGSMILTTGSNTREERNRIKIYDVLGSHIAKLSIVFVGYSFNDDVFIDAVKRVREKAGKDTKKFFALFKNEITDPLKKYKLESLGVTILYGDLKKFTKELCEKYQLHDSTNYSKLRLLIGSNIIPIERSKIFDILDNYRPVDFNSISESVHAVPFLRGKVDSFYPFKAGWHYKRKESEILKECILNGKDDEACKIICVLGNLGSGRTIIIKSSIYELIVKNNSLAIQIQNYAINPFPEKNQIRKYFDEVCNQAEKLEKSKPERIIFWAEFSPDPNLVLKFRELSKELPFPIHFIFEEVTNEKYVEDLVKNFNLTVIEIVNNIADEERENLINYISNTLITHQLPQVSRKQIENIADQEKKFFPIIYRTLYPTKQSIDDIIQQEFGDIKENRKLKELILYCSIASSVNLEIPHTILVKIFRNKFKDPDLNYGQIYDLGMSGPQFLNITPDEQTGYLFSIYHPIIAQKIIAILGQKQNDVYLEDFVKISNLTLVTDSNFIRNLLIVKGEKWFKNPNSYYKFPSTPAGLLNAFKILCDKQPARPILHHYAILIHLLHPHDESVISILENALSESREKYQMKEPKEYILVSLARMKWDLSREKLVCRERDDTEIRDIISLLDDAKNEKESTHPHVLHGRIIMDMWDNANDDKHKLPLLTEAISILEEAYSILQKDDFKGYLRLNTLSERIFRAINSTNPQKALHFAEEFAERGDGTGYYFLGYIAYNDGNNEVCLSHLDRAMKCHSVPYPAIILKMKILMNSDNPPYHGDLLKLADYFTMEQNETWESALMKAIIYTLNNIPTGVQRFFRLSLRKSPSDKKAKIMFQVKENGKLKKFIGKVSPGLTDKEGFIHPHSIKEIRSEIFFDPRSGSNKSVKPLRVGMEVEFTLGFNTMGSVASDVRPFELSQTKIEEFNNSYTT